MIVIPAIDIIGGKAVRLYQGDYKKKEVVGNDILHIAKEFEKNGATYIHLVDLDGAKKGKLVNKKIIVNLAKELSIPIEVGGGIRNYDEVDELINSGVSRVILGTAALEDEEFVAGLVRDFGEKIAVGVDCKKGYICTKGWIEESNVHYIDFCVRMEKIGVKNVILTDISKDGTLEGTNISMVKQLKKYVSINITASGGVRDYYDIKKLNDLDIYGVIIGKALYSGNIEMKRIVELCS
ncbi:1-(5-phosphoribosyl)-5-[(5-phosphoribosylamino)methylideneamino]imidazole-4-carboxamide isomerase [Clostridium sp. D53t1_180928_C8]|uniref:1-(5-phosphoribosyl)-5-[(5- phosphoribosylamino)methylideneamino]imidazole-4- carboxamide isomerase n=1 Tax=Clostridium sp. D53t1_180928_C8 TaxID=2787101 RepID=UPI0018A969BB|nr:1-(5-phosphoribosyl)-5-[(5-phosphoribosylamino)methylideneamino]imidazole-4-carboxamide isomerase [Clostridium sp. D53t1_180928_C8]